MRKKRKKSITQQIQNHAKKKFLTPKKQEYDGDLTNVISTGSTLLDLAISGGRKKEGGIPGGIMVEIFGPSGSGKTVLLCELAGDIQRKGGEVQFRDPEARLNRQFAGVFGLDYDTMNHKKPNTVKEAFLPLYHWDLEDDLVINGYCMDSLAALSTSMEMDDDAGDKMGTRRAKEFSEQLRKCARVIAEKNILLLCTNQLRENIDAGMFGKKHISPGGKAIEYYSSLRLKFTNPKKIKVKQKIKGKEIERVIGVEVLVEVEKSSVWKPHRTSPLTIIFDYGIDDIRQNLQFIKQHSGAKTYALNEKNLGISMNRAIETIEQEGLEKELKEQVISLWGEIEAKFDSNRKKKKR